MIDASAPDEESLVGDIAHIVAEESGGPRGDSPLAPEERDRYSNLILMCKVDHKRIDDQVATYTIERLHAMKAEHEAWVKSSLRFDPRRQADNEVYAGFVDEWARMAFLDKWHALSLGLNSDGLEIEIHESLWKLCLWIHARVWPHRYIELEDALENFRDVCVDFLNTLAKHAMIQGGRIKTQRFYGLDYHPQDVYQSLLSEFNFHEALVFDLVVELTRAANYVCDKVRECVDPAFRINEGALLIVSGPHRGLTYHYHRVEYRDAERTSRPYPGLERFLEARAHRDIHFGVGGSGTGPKGQRGD